MKNLVLVLLSCIFLTGCLKKDKKEINGYVEGEFLMIAPSSGGILSSISVQRAANVKAGDALFSLDLTDLLAQKKSAQSEINSLQTELDNAQNDYERVILLSKTGAVSSATIEDEKTKVVGLTNMLESAKQILVQVENKLAEAAPVAPSDGMIQDIFYEIDEFVAQGKPVISLLPTGNIKVRFYVSEKDVVSIKIGQSLNIHCDGCTAPIPAKISYISSNAEYTPPVIYSVESRDKLVFLIEAKPEEYNSSLRPGLPISIHLKD